MVDHPIASAEQLLGLIEHELEHAEGVLMTDHDLVTGALIVLTSDGRRFEVHVRKTYDA